MRASSGVGQYAASERHVIGTEGVVRGRPLVWCHSAAGDALEPWVAANNTLAIFDGLTKLGFVVVSADLGGQVWGNPTSVARVNSALAYARANFGATTQDPVLLGVSMGGMLALNYARSNAVRALGLFFPAVNLQWMHDNGGTASTEAAYGGSLAAFNAAVAANNPSAHASDFAAIPRKAWYASNDTVVSTAQQETFFTVASVPTVNLGAVGHANMAAVDPAEVVKFASAHL